MSINIQVNAADVIAALNRMENLRGFKRGLAAGGAYLLSNLASYPPQRAGSTYRRTGRLGRSWTLEGRRGGLQIVIGNSTPYAPEVQGMRMEQRPFFAERGWIGPDVAAERHGRAIADLVAAYTREDR